MKFNRKSNWPVHFWQDKKKFLKKKFFLIFKKNYFFKKNWIHSVFAWKNKKKILSQNFRLKHLENTCKKFFFEKTERGGSFCFFQTNFFFMHLPDVFIFEIQKWKEGYFFGAKKKFFKKTFFFDKFFCENFPSRKLRRPT